MFVSLQIPFSKLAACFYSPMAISFTRFFRYTVWVLFLALGLTSSCDLAKQIDQLINLVRCKYKLDGVSSIAVAGVALDGKSLSSGLTLEETANLGLAYLAGSFPMSMNVNVAIQNPQSQAAALSQLDYIMTLEGNPLTTGSLPKAFSIAPGATGILPLPVNIDLIKTFSSKSQTDIINLMLNLAGQSSKPSNLGLRIRPYFQVNGQTVQFPRYFTVNTEFASDSL